MERLSRIAFILELEDIVADGTEYLIASDWTRVDGGLIIYAKYPSGVERIIAGPEMRTMDEQESKYFLNRVQKTCEGYHL
jgi:hypothetical protein